MALINNINIVTNNSAVCGREWLGMTNGDVGQKFIFSMYRDKTVHIEGTFAGASVTMRGSNIANADETVDAHWFDMNNAQGLAAQTSVNDGIVLFESPLWISPKVGAGAGANVNVHMIATGA